MNCLICFQELPIINTQSKNVLISKCYDCDLLFVINIHGIYHTGYVTFPDEFQKLCKTWIKFISESENRNNK